MRVSRTFSVGVVGFGLGVASLTALAATPSETTVAVADAPPSEVVVDLREGFASVADHVVPGVVRIETVRSTSAARPVPNLPRGFDLFFDRGRVPDPQPRVSGGTGFVVDDQGYILTNHHVIDDADEITVWLHDRRSYVGEVVGSDPTTDIAVVRIDAEELSPLQLGDSEALDVGEWVVAIGNPGFAGGQPLDETVTAGIVSAIGRPLPVIRSGLAEDPENRDIAAWAIEDFIQTDAVINPGNSGGPLVDLEGRVVGMNTAIMSTSGYYQGYGFAIPINLVRGVMDDLVEHGTVRRAWLGVQITEVTPEDAEAFGLPGVAGVVVQAVTPGGPGEDAGLRQGDVITAVDGTLIERVGSLQRAVAALDPDERVELTVWRDRDERAVRVRLGEAPIRAEDGSGLRRTRGRLDLERLGLRLEERGDRRDRSITVTEVDPVGPAARRGVRPGAVLRSFDGEPVERIDEVEEHLRSVDGGDVVSLVFEDETGSTRIVNLRARHGGR